MFPFTNFLDLVRASIIFKVKINILTTTTVSVNIPMRSILKTIKTPVAYYKSVYGISFGQDGFNRARLHNALLTKILVENVKIHQV